MTKAMLGVATAVLAACMASAAVAQPATSLTAGEIVRRNAEARGGIEAWRKVETMAWGGHAEMGSSPGRSLTFLLEQKRPNKTRFEIMTEGQRSVRMFDGHAGWKLRPDSSGRPQAQPYTDDELRFARGAEVIDGPLMDYAANGAAIAMAGPGEVDGKPAYVLDVTLPSGGGHRVWVDARTFLELRHERRVQGGADRVAVTSKLLREYRDFQGLQIPTVIETSGEPGRPGNRLVIERVALNPHLDDSAFTRSTHVVSRRQRVTVDTRAAAAGGGARPRSPDVEGATR